MPIIIDEKGRRDVSQEEYDLYVQSIPPTEPRQQSCLEYVLDIFNANTEVKILYNSNHCIAVDEYGIYEKSSNAFKTELLSGELQSSPLKYLKLHEHYSFEQICSTFNLDTYYSELLSQYYGKNSNG
jgi:alpha-tubulin suppressor-like RCC1 family protein